MNSLVSSPLLSILPLRVFVRTLLSLSLIFIVFWSDLTFPVDNSLAPVTKVVIATDDKIMEDHEDIYYIQLLELVLTKTIATYGPYVIKTIPVMPIDHRLMREIEKNRVDITWSTYQPSIDLSVRAVKTDLLKGISNYRVFLIRKEDQEKFNTVNSLEDLRKFRSGLGAHWPDRKVMEENKLPTVTNISYPNLFKMLLAKRFDYFSRGVYQILPELEKYAKDGLAIEERLMLYYENPVYFHVNKNNFLLAQRLEDGLKLAIEDGSFDQLFNQYPRFIWAQEQINSGKRLVIPLRTP
jgi:hypothetical protein